MDFWITSNIIFDLESVSSTNVFLVAHDQHQATHFSSSDADKYVNLLKPLATHINWRKEPATEDQSQFVIKGTDGTTHKYHPPSEVDKLWLGHGGEADPELQSNEKEKQRKAYRKLACDALKLTQPGFWESFRLSFIECGIVCNRFFCGHSFRATLGRRIYNWETHIITFLEFTKTNLLQHTSTTINHLCSHLDVVDGKVGRLLQFQALIFVAIATGAGTVWKNYHDAVQKHHPHGPVVLSVLFWIGFGLWVLATALCFWAVRRAAWGDYERQVCATDAKKAYITFLILEVIKRTAKYRVAVPLTVASLLCLVVCLPVLFILMR